MQGALEAVLVVLRTLGVLGVLGIVAAAVGLLALINKVPLSYNLLNLQVRWRTTALTALAFTLVVGILTGMLAFVNGMYALTAASGQPGNVVILSEGSTDESFSNLGFSDIGDIENQPGIARDGDVPLVSRETFLVVNQPIVNAPPGRPKRRFLQLRGIDVPETAARVHDVALHPGGTWFSSAGVRDLAGGDAPSGGSAVEVVVGEGIARELGRDRSPEQIAAARNPGRLDVGDTFLLNERTWLVVGVMQSAGSTFDSEVWGLRSLLGPMFGKETYSTLVARAAPDAQTKTVEAAAQALADFFKKDYTKAALNAQVETAYFASLSSTNQQFLWAIGFVAVTMALGGSFGVMNTMFAAISQRTRDIGVLRLLGFKRWQILVSFLLESLVIAVLGGALGCLLGSLCDGWSANSIVSAGPGGGKFVVLKLTVDATVLAVGLLLSFGMGFFGGLIPSLAAMRLSALDALR